MAQQSDTALDDYEYEYDATETEVREQIKRIDLTRLTSKKDIFRQYRPDLVQWTLSSAASAILH